MNSFISNFKKQGKRAFPELLGFVLFLFLFDRLLFEIIKRGEWVFYNHISPFSLSEKFSRIKNKDEYKILILGTSRTYEGIHPWYIKNELGIKAFKEAFVGKGPIYNYFFYQEYKKYFGIPRVVIYGVDYFIFNQNSEKYWMKRFNADVTDALYYDRGISMLLTNKAKIDKFSNTFLNNLQKNFLSAANFLIENDINLMEKYLGVVSPESIEIKEPPGYRRIKFFKYPGKEGVYFERLLAELQRDKVTTLLVSLPDYIGTFLTNSSQEQYQSALKYLQQKYNNVFFLNYNQVEIFDLTNPEYFINGGYGKTNSHLSRVGAEIFNHIFIKDLRKYLPENEIQKRK
jgi:hypothetical protein